MPTYTTEVPELGTVKFEHPDRLSPEQIDGVINEVKAKKGVREMPHTDLRPAQPSVLQDLLGAVGATPEAAKSFGSHVADVYKAGVNKPDPQWGQELLNIPKPLLTNLAQPDATSPVDQAAQAATGLVSLYQTGANILGLPFSFVDQMIRKGFPTGGPQVSAAASVIPTIAGEGMRALVPQPGPQHSPAINQLLEALGLGAETAGQFGGFGAEFGAAGTGVKALRKGGAEPTALPKAPNLAGAPSPESAAPSPPRAPTPPEAPRQPTSPVAPAPPRPPREPVAPRSPRQPTAPISPEEHADMLRVMDEEYRRSKGEAGSAALPNEEELKKLAGRFGAIFNGVQKIPDKPDQWVFTDKESGGTTYMPAGVAPEVVKARLDKLRSNFGLPASGESTEQGKEPDPSLSPLTASERAEPAPAGPSSSAQQLRVAFKVGDQTFTGEPGETHPMLYVRMKAQGVPEAIRDKALLDDTTHGFVDEQGNFLNRQEAYNKQGVFDSTDKVKPTAEDVKGRQEALTRRRLIAQQRFEDERLKKAPSETTEPKQPSMELTKTQGKSQGQGGAVPPVETTAGEGAKTLSYVIQGLELRKSGEDYEVFHQGQRIGRVHKGWSRLGGSGWVGQLPDYQNITKAHKNLDSIKRAIADRILQKEKAARTEPSVLETSQGGRAKPETPPSGSSPAAQPFNIDRTIGESLAASLGHEEPPMTKGGPEVPMTPEEKAARLKKGEDWGRSLRDESGSIGLPTLDELKELFRIGGATTRKVAGTGLWGRMQNMAREGSIHPDELKMYEDAGLKDFLKEPRSLEEVHQFMEKNGPKVEVKSLVAEGHESPKLQRKIASISHQLDGLLPNWQNLSGSAIDAKGGEIARLHQELVKLSEEDYMLPDVESATARYTRVNPKPLDKMPGAVDLLVRIPLKSEITPAMQAAEIDPQGYPGLKDVYADKGVRYTSPHYPTEGKNLVSHVRGYMETTPDGKKVFHVFEVQSDWAQVNRESLEYLNKLEPRMVARDLSGKKQEWRIVTPDDRYASISDNKKFPSKEAALAEIERQKSELRPGGKASDPTLAHYERLALKAAIDHARSQGATHIAISDAETAMMSEGHDRQMVAETYHPAYMTEEQVRNSVREQGYDPDNYTYKKVPRTHGEGDVWKLSQINPEQSKGMRLHYDRTLPKIAEELTGAKGERVSFGEHQNAFESSRGGPPEPPEGWEPRKDLIFKNPDGSPKTDVTAKIYPIDKARTAFSIMGRDRAVASSKGELGALSLPTKEDLAKVLIPFRRLMATASQVPARKHMAALVDGLNSQASLAGERVGKAVKALGYSEEERAGLGTLSANLGDTPEATIAALNKAKEQLSESSVLPAINKAIEMASDPQAMAQARTMREVLETQLGKEHAAGVETPVAANYFPRQIGEYFSDPEASLFTPQTGTSRSGFMKPRRLETWADFIQAVEEQGHTPRIDAADIMEQRVKAGTYQIALKEMIKEGRTIIDPATKKTIFAGEGEVGKEYKSVVGVPGVKALAGYDRLLSNLIRPSTLAESPVGKGALFVSQLQKRIGVFYDTFHLGRVFYNWAGAKGGVPDMAKGKALIEMGVPETERFFSGLKESGAISEAEYKTHVEDAKIFEQGVKHGLLMDRHAEALTGVILNKIPGLEATSKYIFEKVTRSAMADIYTKWFRENKQRFPNLPENQVHTRTAREVNAFFFNVKKQGIFTNPEFQTVSRIALFAQSFTEAEVTSEIQGIGQLIKAPKDLATKGTIGNVIKAKTAIVLGTIAANQILSYALNGHSTFENPDKDKMFSAYVPNNMPTRLGYRAGLVSKEPKDDKGFYNDPWTLAFPVGTALVNSMMKGRNAFQAIGDYFGSRLGVLPKGADYLYTGEKFGGEPMRVGAAGDTWRVVKGTVEETFPLPFAVREALKGKDLTRQLAATFGIKLTQEQTLTRHQVESMLDKGLRNKNASWIVSQALEQRLDPETHKVQGWYYNPEKAEEAIKDRSYPPEVEREVRKVLRSISKGKVFGRNKMLRKMNQEEEKQGE